MSKNSNEFLNHIPSIITVKSNRFYARKFQWRKLKIPFFSMKGDKAPGLDGFPPSFFQIFWEIVKMDIWEMVEEAREKRYISKEINNTFIALIPKKENVQSFDDFYPILLCNTTYNIIAKVMANRLKNALHVIISEDKSDSLLTNPLLRESL